MIISVPVQTAVCALRADGASTVPVGVQVSVVGLYLQPLLRRLEPSQPPQTIISAPVQTAVRSSTVGPKGVPMLVAIQVSVEGLYLPPVWKTSIPHTIISVPVQTALCPLRPDGALTVAVGVQLSVFGLYLLPVFKLLPLYPPQTIISVPVQTAVCALRAEGAFVVLVDIQVFVAGSYLAPLLRLKEVPL